MEGGSGPDGAAAPPRCACRDGDQTRPTPSDPNLSNERRDSMRHLNREMGCSYSEPWLPLGSFLAG